LEGPGKLKLFEEFGTPKNIFEMERKPRIERVLLKKSHKLNRISFWSSRF